MFNSIYNPIYDDILPKSKRILFKYTDEELKQLTKKCKKIDKMFEDELRLDNSNYGILIKKLIKMDLSLRKPLTKLIDKYYFTYSDESIFQQQNKIIYLAINQEIIKRFFKNK